MRCYNTQCVWFCFLFFCFLHILGFADLFFYMFFIGPGVRTVRSTHLIAHKTHAPGLSLEVKVYLMHRCWKHRIAPKNIAVVLETYFFKNFRSCCKKYKLSSVLLSNTISLMRMSNWIILGRSLIILTKWVLFKFLVWVFFSDCKSKVLFSVALTFN